jgi:hypothetical protein
MKVFHYTTRENIGLILQQGLHKMNHNFIFAFESPEPLEWVRNTFFPTLWSSVFKPIYTVGVLLEITLDEEDIKSAFVRDYVHFMKYQHLLKYDPETFPTFYNYSSQKEAMDEMKDTRVTLPFYILHKFSLEYQLPEILLTKPILPHKIKIISQ